MRKVKCNMCDWIGDEEKIKLVPSNADNVCDEDEACPKCGAVGYLMDIENDITKPFYALRTQTLGQFATEEEANEFLDKIMKEEKDPSFDDYRVYED